MMSLTQSNLCTCTRMIHNGPVQLASKIGQRLHTVLRCHLKQTSKELKIDITLLIDVNKCLVTHRRYINNCMYVSIFCLSVCLSIYLSIYLSKQIHVGR